MGIKRSITAGTAVAATAALGFGVVAAAPATAKAGDNPLASVLVDKNKFDKNKKDYDIVTEAVLAVLAEKPDSAVSVLTDGSVRLTAFVPQDRAFFPLVKALTGTKPKSERAAFKAVASLGIDTVETVLLYHVVPGATITAKKALKANGAKLETAQGGTIKVKVRHSTITLKDKDPDLKNPKVVQVNINKGNKQIAHGINRVLLPVNL
jgi:uncharacterized surface protein with fasciclin (FAS1) repeats